MDVNPAGIGLTANYLGTTVGVESARLSAGTWTRGILVNEVPNTGTAFATRRSPRAGRASVSWGHDPDGAGTQVKRILARTNLAGVIGQTLTLSDRHDRGELQQAQLTSSAGPSFAVWLRKERQPVRRITGASTPRSSTCPVLAGVAVARPTGPSPN